MSGGKTDIHVSAEIPRAPLPLHILHNMLKYFNYKSLAISSKIKLSINLILAVDFKIKSVFSLNQLFREHYLNRHN